jgi:hypothetical protein
MPGSQTAPGRLYAPVCAHRRVAFDKGESVGTRDSPFFAAQWLAYAFPCQRFVAHLAVRHA